MQPRCLLTWLGRVLSTSAPSPIGVADGHLGFDVNKGPILDLVEHWTLPCKCTYDLQKCRPVDGVCSLASLLDHTCRRRNANLGDTHAGA